MTKKVRGFFKEYLHLSLVVVAVVAGLFVYLLGYHATTKWLLSAAAIVSVIPILWEMIQDLRSGEYGLDILAATAIITSVVLGEYWAGIVIVLMLTGGEALENYAQRRAKTELNALLHRAPKIAHIIRGRKTLDVPVRDIKVNDKLIIKPGEVVPVDCVVLEGFASFDESSLTGESLPVEKGQGEQLLSGSINTDAVVTIKALHTAADSQFEQIVKLVRSAASSQSPFVRLADRYSIPFTIASFAIAITVWVLSGQAIRFLEVLVVATPCPLLLGAPIALISGMSRAAKHGIIIKTGSAMERLAEVKTIGFDKTGTLTQGKPIVDKVIPYNSYSIEDIVRFAAALEQNSAHVLAQAIVNEADKHKIKLPKVKQMVEEPGHGLRGTVDGHQVLVGKWGFIHRENVKIPKAFAHHAPHEMAAFVAIDGLLAGAISFIDKIRPESKSTLNRLRSTGIEHFLMVTGDNKATASAIAKQLGIDDVRAECLPADKLMAVESVKNRPVAFVGDGVNDAPVLAASDAGIALGARGSTVASESADVVIMLDDISRVAVGVEIAKRTFSIARQSILIGIFISFGLMAIFATGKFRPVYGAALQEAVDVAVIFNALRAHGSWNNKKRAAPVLLEHT